MKISIAYFSATGNTRFIAERITEALKKQKQVVSLINIESFESEIEQPDLLILGFPCYSFDYPHMMIDPFLEKIFSAGMNTPVFALATYCLGTGNTFYRLQKRLKQYSIPLIGTNSIKCPSAGFVAITAGKKTPLPSFFLSKAMIFERNLFERIELTKRFILNSIDAYKSCKKAKSFIYNPLASLMTLFAEKNEERIFNHYFIDKTKCIECGKCLNHCPEQNFIVNKGKIDFKNKNDCLRCVRCLNNCPVDAITLGKKTKNGYRYRLSKYLPTTPG